MRTVFAVVAFAFTPVAALAQPVPPPAPLAPSQVVNGPEPPFLQPGKEVSQPLTPVGPAPADVPPVAPKAEPKVEFAPEAKVVPPERVRGPLGPGWSSYELLYWWPMRQPVPPLVVGTRSGLPPVFGEPGTSVLVGGGALDSEPHAGGRFSTGSALNCAQTFGYDITYFFLGTRTFREHVSDAPGTGVGSFGLPYTNAGTGASEVLLLAEPGRTNSHVGSSRVDLQACKLEYSIVSPK